MTASAAVTGVLAHVGAAHAADTSVTVDFSVAGGAPTYRASGMMCGITPDGSLPQDHFFKDIKWRLMWARGARLNSGGYATSLADYQTRWNATLAQYKRTVALGGTFVNRLFSGGGPARTPCAPAHSRVVRPRRPRYHRRRDRVDHGGNVDRRQFLLAAGVSGLLVGCSGPSSGPSGGGRAPGPLGFGNALRIPPLLDAVVEPDGTRRFALTMQRGQTGFLTGTTTPTWGFNGSYLGPTIRAARGDRVRMSVLNRLGESSTVHWHGMRLPAVMDGGPHQPIAPDATWEPHWTIDQPATTAWYHPHPHGSTAMHVYRGLAGLFIIDDGGTVDLPAAYGIDDVPLILQDKRFGRDGTMDGDPMQGTFGILGDHILVNGTYDPQLTVRTERVRFRILNGSNARKYNLAFADHRTFHVVGNDAGLLPAPVQVSQVSVTPGERVEIVAGFAPGEQVLLRTESGPADIEQGDLDLLKIVAAARLDASPRVPQRLADPVAITVPADARTRRFELNGHDAINHRGMDLSRIDEVVPAGATEVWEIRNNVYAHNFHIHEVAFQILDVAGQPPPAYATGAKDTVYVPAKSTVRLAVRFGRFTDPAAPYMYHCHILRHEDSGMMGQFVIVEPGTENQVPRSIPAAGHHT